MTLNELTIRGFGKFHDRTFTFSDGINILYGKNESGKSTLHSFLRAMLFGMERARGRAAKTDFFAHFEPWFWIFPSPTRPKAKRSRSPGNFCRSFWGI